MTCGSRPIELTIHEQRRMRDTHDIERVMGTLFGALPLFPCWGFLHNPAKRFNPESVARGELRPFSTPTLNAGGYIVPSDRRLKKDIKDTDLGLDFIEHLRPVSYRFKTGNIALRYGFIAQELEQALPPELQDMVEKNDQNHGLFLVGRDDDTDRFYHVDYSELISPVVKSIQQLKSTDDAVQKKEQDDVAAQQRENEALKQQISVLASQIADLKKLIATQQKEIAELRGARPTP